MLRVRALAAALAVNGLACGPLRPPALDPSGLADPSWTDDAAEALAKPVLAVSAAPPAPPPPPAPAVPRPPASTTGCPFRWVPKDLRASVVIIPSSFAGRFMVPLFDAVCACTRPGDHVAVVARIRTLPGDIVAFTAARDEGIAADPGIDACLGAVLGSTEFEGFEVPSDVVCVSPPPDPPKTKMGPPFFQFPRRAGCPAPGTQSATIVYPITVDRRGES